MGFASEISRNITFENGIWRGPSRKLFNHDYQIGKLLLNQLRENPKFIGQIDGLTGAEDTFGAMLDRSIRCALWLQKQGLQTGDVISVSTHNHLNTVIPMLASLYIGCTLNTFLVDCLDKDLTDYFINLVEPKVIFANERSIKFINESSQQNKTGVKVIVFERNIAGFISLEDILLESTIMEVEKFECTEIQPEQAAQIMFSSGSTGYPKGIIRTYKQLVHDLGWLPNDVVKYSRGTWCSNVSWVTTIIAIFSAIAGRSTSVIHSGLDIPDLCQVIDKYKINWIMLGIRHINTLPKVTSAGNFDLSSVKFVRFCGSYVTSELEKQLHTVFPEAWLSQSYGITEFGCVTYAMEEHKHGSCGVPMDNVEIKLINADGKTVLVPNQEGELYLRSPTLKICYVKNPDATKDALDSEGWYRSGDLGYYAENGEFFIVDRIKEIIKFRTGLVPPGTIENLIREHPSVSEVAVVAKLHNKDVEQPMAFIVKAVNREVTSAEIKDLVETNLPDRMKLRGGVIFLNQMPYNDSGKIAKKELRHLVKILNNLEANNYYIEDIFLRC